MNNTLESFIFHSRQAASIDSLFIMYEEAMAHYGFDHLAYAVISDHPELKNGDTLGLAVKNDLNGWTEHYLDSNYIAIDPGPKITYNHAGFYSWEDMAKQEGLSQEQRYIFKEAEEIKLHNGINISIHNTNGVKCVAIAASSHMDLQLNQYIIDSIHMLAYQFNICFLSLNKPQTKKNCISLSQKEKEVLKWAAEGLSQTEIAKILNISNHTVNYHNRNIFKKLNTKNMTAALVIAIKENLIII